MNKQQAKLFAQHAHLSADRRLDIALLILLGYRVFGYGDWDDEQEHPYYIPTNKPWRTHQVDAKPVPRISTTWDAAGALVAKMGERGWWLKLTTAPTIGDQCLASFIERVPTPVSVHATAPAAPAAIARAAYHALDGQPWEAS
jgi:hypothetical protein